MGTDFAISQMCPAEGGFSRYKQFLDDGGKIAQGGLDCSKVAVSRKVRSFRIELADLKWKENQSPFALDGSVFWGCKIQGSFEENHVKQLC